MGVDFTLTTQIKGETWQRVCPLAQYLNAPRSLQFDFEPPPPIILNGDQWIVEVQQQLLLK